MSSKFKKCVWAASLFFTFYLGFALNRLWTEINLASLGQFGDSFGFITSLFTLIAAWGLYEQISTERKNHAEEMKEQRRAAEGYERPVIVPSNEVKFRSFTDTSYNYKANLKKCFFSNPRERQSWQKKIDDGNVTGFVEMCFERWSDVIFNSLFEVVIKGCDDCKFSFSAVGRIGSFWKPLNGSNAEHFKFIFPIESTSIYMLSGKTIDCTISVYYENRLGGCFRCTRKMTQCLYTDVVKPTPEEGGYATLILPDESVNIEQLDKNSYEQKIKDLKKVKSPYFFCQVIVEESLQRISQEYKVILHMQ